MGILDSVQQVNDWFFIWLSSLIMIMSGLSRKIRFRLFLVRFITSYVPLGITQRLTGLSVKMADLPESITTESVVADGVPCEWIIPQELEKDRILVYLHGGGFVFGLSAPHLEMVAYLAQKIQAKVLMVDYRLAPKDPFPAALDDCVSAYRWLLSEGFDPDHITIAGDSAGGNLTITTLMKLRDEGDPLPVAAACLSPVADLAEREHLEKDLVLPPRAVKKYRQSYLADSDPANPLISPIYGDWNDLPPLLIHAGEEERLREDALRIKEVAEETNTHAEIKIFPKMFHVWQIYPDLPETQESLDDIADFLTSPP